MISTLGRYKIISEIGQGAMGVVYKAVDPIIDRTVAIKTINLNLSRQELEEYEARFQQEIKAAGRLNHPNIVTIYDVDPEFDLTPAEAGHPSWTRTFAGAKAQAKKAIADKTAKDKARPGSDKPAAPPAASVPPKKN